MTDMAAVRMYAASIIGDETAHLSPEQLVDVYENGPLPVRLDDLPDTQITADDGIRIREHLFRFVVAAHDPTAWGLTYDEARVAAGDLAEYLSVESVIEEMQLATTQAIEDGQLYIVTADMTRLSQAAGGGLPYVQIHRDTPYTAAGLMLFERPIGPHTYRVDAVSWMPTEENEALCITAFRIEGDVIEIVGIELIDFDIEMRVPEDLSSRWVRPVLASWHVMRETLAVVETAEPSRSLKRRSRRANTFIPEIRIVHLRKRERRQRASTPLAHEVAWQYQWLVGGHWRQQWYPRLQEHRLRWIAPFVKGPKDKPLKVREKVVVWDR